MRLKVGDLVRVLEQNYYSVTKEGSVGTVVSGDDKYTLVAFLYFAKNYRRHQLTNYTISNKHLRHITVDELPSRIRLRVVRGLLGRATDAEA